MKTWILLLCATALGCDSGAREISDSAPQTASEVRGDVDANATEMVPASDHAISAEDAERLPLAAGVLARTLGRSAEARSLVLGAYGLAVGPDVQYRTLSYLTCGFASGWDNGGGGCVDGGWRNTTPVPPIQVALSPGETLSDSALAHELCHYRAWVTTGDPDQGHTGACFVPGGFVDQAVAALVEVGL